jgi:hypothetical protein
VNRSARYRARRASSARRAPGSGLEPVSEHAGRCPDWPLPSPVVTQSQPVGRQMRARYAFGGAVVELARTAPLEDGEDVLLHGAMRLRGVGVLPRPVVLRLTPQRLTVLAHYAFQPDRLWDLPRGSVQAVDLVGRVLRIAWAPERPEGRSVLQLTGWTGRSALDGALRDAGAVAEALTQWLHSPNGGR